MRQWLGLAALCGRGGEKWRQIGVEEKEKGKKGGGGGRGERGEEEEKKK